MRVDTLEVTGTKMYGGGGFDVFTSKGTVRIHMCGECSILQKVLKEMLDWGWKTVAYIKGVLYVNGLAKPNIAGVHSYTVTFVYA